MPLEEIEKYKITSKKADSTKNGIVMLKKVGT